MGSFGISKQINVRPFNHLGGVTTTSGNLCIAAIRAANERCYGSPNVHEPADALNSRLIVLWGKNPPVTLVHTVPVWEEARKRNIPIILVDPLEISSAKLCDRQFQIRPASDAFLLLGMARVLIERDLVDRDFIRLHSRNFEGFARLCLSQSLEEAAGRCGLLVSEVEEFALLYGGHRPASVYMGRGVQRGRWAIETSCLINALAAMTGNVGVPGGGVSCFAESFPTFDLDLAASDRAKYQRAIPKPTIGQ